MARSRPDHRPHAQRLLRQRHGPRRPRHRSPRQLLPTPFAPTAKPPLPIPRPRVPQLLLRHFLFAVVLLICLLPTLITRYIIYGNAFESGYIPLRHWFWFSPVFFKVLFSSNHGLLAWTPILFFSIAGLFIFWRWQRRAGTPFLAAFLAFYLFISCYPDWAGISSYGNRFFVSLTPLFILGLAVFLDRLAQLFRSHRAALAAASALLALFTLWNVGLMFQWGSHLIPARGPVSFSEIVHNQFFVVPRQLSADLQRYLFKRKALMQQIEDRDLQPARKKSSASLTLPCSSAVTLIPTWSGSPPSFCYS